MGASRARCIAAASAAALLAATPPAHTAVIGTCTINVLSPGEMRANPAISRLGSKEAGGEPARVSIRTNSLVCYVLGLLDCYRISAPAPAGFLSAPAGGDSGVTFATSYRIGGGGDIAGNIRTEVFNGTYQVAIDLAAERASGVFPAGAYQAQVTVRCE